MSRISLSERRRSRGVCSCWWWSEYIAQISITDSWLHVWTLIFNLVKNSFRFTSRVQYHAYKISLSHLFWVRQLNNWLVTTTQAKWSKINAQNKLILWIIFSYNFISSLMTMKKRIFQLDILHGECFTCITLLLGHLAHSIYWEYGSGCWCSFCSHFSFFYFEAIFMVCLRIRN